MAICQIHFKATRLYGRRIRKKSLRSRRVRFREQMIYSQWE